MHHLAILTSVRVPELLDYDKKLVLELMKLGINAEPVIWETEADKLTEFDSALFRTTWGYHEKSIKFIKFLDFIDKIKIPVFNPTSIIRENLHKFYLNELIKYELPTIDTIFVEKNSGRKLKEHIGNKYWNQFIIKPAISAGSYETHLLSLNDWNKTDEIYSNMNETSDLLIQRFIPEIQTIGEWSTIFFNPEYHYTINKVPKSGDYRVQTTFDGVYTKRIPPLDVLETSHKAASIYFDKCLYIRVDGVISEDQFKIMEIEMIEPDLYLDIYPEAIPVFADNIANRILK